MAKGIQSDYDIDYEKLTDSEVWKAILAGDREAFGLLFSRYYDDLYHYAVKFSGRPGMAEDHIQKLFLKIWHRRDSLEEVKGVKTYLWSALRRSMIDTFRKEKAERKYLDKIDNGYARMQYTTEELVIHDETSSARSRELKKAIGQLNSRQREVLYLKFYEGMSYEEIEQIMSVSYQTSRNYVYQALQALKEILTPEVIVGLVLFAGFLVFFSI
mgnify:CR=1 FL=1